MPPSSTCSTKPSCRNSAWCRRPGWSGRYQQLDHRDGPRPPRAKAAPPPGVICSSSASAPPQKACCGLSASVGALIRVALGSRRPARRGRPPLRPPHRCTGVLTPENGGDEPPAPRWVSLHPSGPARAGLRHQGSARAGRCDNTWSNNLITLLGSPDGWASNSNTSSLCRNGKWSILMAIDSCRCSLLATPAAPNQAGVPRQGLSQVQQPTYRLL